MKLTGFSSSAFYSFPIAQTVESIDVFPFRYEQNLHTEKQSYSRNRT